MIAGLSNKALLRSLLWVSSHDFIKRTNIQWLNSLETSPSTVRTRSFCLARAGGRLSLLYFLSLLCRPNRIAGSLKSLSRDWMRVVRLSILMTDKYGMSLLHYGTNPTVVVSSSMSWFFCLFFNCLRPDVYWEVDSCLCHYNYSKYDWFLMHFHATVHLLGHYQNDHLSEQKVTTVIPHCL